MGTRTKQTLLQQIIRYTISGGAFFWSGYLMFALLYSGLDLGVGWSKVLSYLFGLSVNFALTRWWVFRTREPLQHLPEVSIRYLGLAGVNLAIDYGIVIGLDSLGITPYIGQFISAGFFTVWNFFFYKFWVFSPHVHHRKKTLEGGR
jgi:putative flippase GtrA